MVSSCVWEGTGRVGVVGWKSRWLDVTSFGCIIGSSRERHEEEQAGRQAGRLQIHWLTRQAGRQLGGKAGRQAGRHCSHCEHWSHQQEWRKSGGHEGSILSGASFGSAAAAGMDTWCRFGDYNLSRQG